MAELAAGVMTLNECPTCKGRWYDFDELLKVITDQEAFAAAVKKGPLRPHQGQARCPVCLEEMINGGFGSDLLRVDQCPGHGIWLDAEELLLLNKLMAS